MMAPRWTRRPDQSAATFAPATSARSSPTTAPSTPRVRGRLDLRGPRRRQRLGGRQARLSPSRASSCWIVEHRRAATPAAWRSPTRATGLAALRWFVLDPGLRGPGPRPAAGRRTGLASAESRRLRGVGSRPSASCAPRRTSTARTGSSSSSADRPALGPRRDHLPALRAQLPGARPVVELAEHRLERAALLGQRVGHPRRRPSWTERSTSPAASSSRSRRESSRSDRPGTLVVSSAK